MDKKIKIKNIGSITSMGGDTRNADYFNIFTKEALFDYDISKKIYEYCLEVEKSDGDLEGIYGIGDYYNKRKIDTEDYYMDEIGNEISILEIEVPKLGKGIAHISSPHLINNSFIKNFVKFDKPLYSHIEVKDNTLCFGFFDMIFDIGFSEFENIDFYNVKNKPNIAKFKKFIKKKYVNVLNKSNMGASNIVECSVPNGIHRGYDIMPTKSLPNTPYDGGGRIGQLYICESK